MATASSATLPLFWDLASNDESKRLGSSSKLVSTLLNQQSSLPSTSRTTLDDDVTLAEDAELQVQARHVEEKLDKLLAAEVSYSLRRLTRGLASPREQSRLGFSAALTELLSRIDVLSVSDIIVLVLKYSTPDGKVSRSEERNLHFARLFGIQALVCSGTLYRDTTTPKDITKIISILVELGEKKSPLRESTGWVMVQMLQAISSPSTTVSPQVESATVKTLSEYASSGDLSPEKLAILLKLSQASATSTKVPALKSKDVLSSGNMPVLAKILRNAPSIESFNEEAEEAGSSTPKANGGKKNAQTGAFNPRVHFVWDVILDTYYGERGAPAYSYAPFAELYMECVDETMFAATASSERKSWGFQVFSKALPVVPSADKPLLFTPNFMRTWINQLASKDRLLHKAATSAATVVQETVAQDPRTAFALTSQLLGKHGSHNFDRLTNTKTIEGILASMDSQGVAEYTLYIVETIATSGEESKRRWGFDQLHALVRNTAIPTDDKLTEEIIEYLIASGFFSWKKAPSSKPLLSQQPKPALNDAVRAVARSRFLSCLTELTERTTSIEGKSQRAQGINAKGELWISKAWDIFNALSRDTKTFSSTIEDYAIEATKAGSALLAKVRKASKAASSNTQKFDRLAAFETLLLASLLYLVDSSEDAADLIEPLEDCYASLFEEGEKTGKARVAAAGDDEEEEEGEEPTGIELLQDYLIGLLERPSAFLRAIAEQVFGVFVSEMNEQSVDHLVDQLGLSEEPEDDDVDGKGDGKDEETGDAESDTSSDSGDVDEDDEDEDDGDNEPVDVELRNEVLEALKSVGMAEEEDEDSDKDDGDAAAADDDADSDADSLPDFTDEQMMQVDDRLAEIFRSRVNTKKNEKEAKQDSVAFQNKILDLLAIFAKKQRESVLVLRLVRPLFVIATEGSETLDKQVSTKATTILRNTICKAKEVPQGGDVDSVADDLEAVHAYASKGATSSELASLASTVNLYLTRVAASHSETAALVARYKATINDFLTRKTSQLKPQFLLDALKKFPTIGWALRDDLLEICSPKSTNATSIKSFRQQQALQMVSTVLTHNATTAAKTEVTTTMQDAASLVFLSVASAVESPTANAATLKEVLKLGLQAARLTKRVLADDGDRLSQIWKPAKIQEASASLAASDRFKQSSSLLGLLKQMAAIVSGGGGGAGAKGDKKRKSDVSAATPVLDGNTGAEGQAKKVKTAKRVVSGKSGKKA